jgi:hypothetical protein
LMEGIFCDYLSKHLGRGDPPLTIMVKERIPSLPSKSTSSLHCHVFLIFYLPLLFLLEALSHDGKRWLCPFLCSLITYHVGAPRMATCHYTTNNARRPSRTPSSSWPCLPLVPNTSPRCHYYTKNFARRFEIGLGDGWTGCLPRLFMAG